MLVTLVLAVPTLQPERAATVYIPGVLTELIFVSAPLLQSMELNVPVICKLTGVLGHINAEGDG